MWLPRGRGADPQVDTTVASAIGSPAQARAAARTESLSAMHHPDHRPFVSSAVEKHRRAWAEPLEQVSRLRSTPTGEGRGVRHTGGSPARILSSVIGKSRTRTPQAL